MANGLTPGLPFRAAIWSAPGCARYRHRPARSANGARPDRARFDQDGFQRRRPFRRAWVGVQHHNLVRHIGADFVGPLPAEWLFNHWCPRSSPCWCASASLASTIDDTGADSRLSTKAGLTFSLQLIFTWWSSTLLRCCSTFFAFQPSCVRINDGSRLSFHHP